MNQIGSTLLEIIQDLRPQLEALGEPIVSQKPAINKWSKKEILGHLIDSAANNHQRFVRIRLQDHLVFQGYDQDEWVALQDYQNRQWKEIIELWYQYNWHLGKYIEQIPKSVMEKEHKEHNLFQIAYITVPKEESTTLSYFIGDYVGHLEHHARQILPNYQPQVLKPS